MSEADLQAKIIKYLKKKGCYVIKTKPGMGTPVGCPDIIALFEGCWFAFEVKASKVAKYQPLQKKTLAKLSDWGFAYTIFPENYNEIIATLEQIL